MLMPSIDRAPEQRVEQWRTETPAYHEWHLARCPMFDPPHARRSSAANAVRLGDIDPKCGTRRCRRPVTSDIEPR
jgi:hypothetical protein